MCKFYTFNQQNKYFNKKLSFTKTVENKITLISLDDFALKILQF